MNDILITRLKSISINELSDSNKMYFYRYRYDEMRNEGPFYYAYIFKGKQKVIFRYNSPISNCIVCDVQIQNYSCEKKILVTAGYYCIIKISNGLDGDVCFEIDSLDNYNPYTSKISQEQFQKIKNMQNFFEVFKGESNDPKNCFRFVESSPAKLHHDYNDEEISKTYDTLSQPFQLEIKSDIVTKNTDMNIDTNVKLPRLFAAIGFLCIVLGVNYGVNNLIKR